VLYAYGYLYILIEPVKSRHEGVDREAGKTVLMTKRRPATPLREANASFHPAFQSRLSFLDISPRHIQKII
jgi:hypothetical protein